MVGTSSRRPGKPAEATELNALAKQSPGRVRIAKLEMNDPAELDGVRRQLAGVARVVLDVALINAGCPGPGAPQRQRGDRGGDRRADVHQRDRADPPGARPGSPMSGRHRACVAFTVLGHGQRGTEFRRARALPRQQSGAELY